MVLNCKQYQFLQDNVEYYKKISKFSFNHLNPEVLALYLVICFDYCSTKILSMIL